MRDTSLSKELLHKGNQEECLVFQEAIDQIILRFFSKRKQGIMQLLTYIHEFTRSEVFLGSPSQLASLAILSNHLLQFVSTERTKRLFIVSDTTPIYIKELNATLNVKLEVGEWDDNGYKLKKFLWGDTDRQLLVDLITIYSYYAYINMPQQLEIFDLYAGRKTVYKVNDVRSAMQRVKRRVDRGNVSTMQGASFFLIYKINKGLQG
jgi:hypothetical protein